MTSGGASVAPGTDATGIEAAPPLVEVVVPVHNEAPVLGARVSELHRYLTDRFPFSWRITVVDNASTDGTWGQARALAAELPGVAVRRLERKGRGRALRAAWLASDAAVVAYMDVDLSTGLDALLPLVAPLLSGHSDVSVGSRLASGARVVRGPRRELISRSYNRLLQLVLDIGVRDAQCGFKAVRADVAAALVPAVADDAWFFDTELLVLAERSGLRIAELPVDWVDDPDSRVDIVATAREDLRGIVRLVRLLWSRPVPVRLGAAARPAPPVGTGGELVSFVSVGAVCTVSYVVMFLVLRGRYRAQPANLLSLTTTLVLNTAAHRRLTFGRRGADDRVRHWGRAGGVHLAGLALTAAALEARARWGGTDSRATEAAVALTASAAATGLRFVLMPGWVFGTTTSTATREGDKR
jgi:putative flippase GtrA